MSTAGAISYLSSVKISTIADIGLIVAVLLAVAFALFGKDAILDLLENDGGESKNYEKRYNAEKAWTDYRSWRKSERSEHSQIRESNASYERPEMEFESADEANVREFFEEVAKRYEPDVGNDDWERDSGKWDGRA